LGLARTCADEYVWFNIMKPVHLSHIVPPSKESDAPAPSLLALHVLRWLAAQQPRSGRVSWQRPTLDHIVTGVGARRAEVRAVLSQLHRQGYYDVLRGGLTLAGFTIGRSLTGAALTPLRMAPAADVSPAPRSAAA